MGAVGAGTDEAAGERRQLPNVAYRLLGSLTEVEDAVQDAYARWHGLSRSQRADIRSPGAWLTTVTGRSCLDLLGPARARRERHVGVWLPEPLPDRTDRGRAPGAGRATRAHGDAPAQPHSTDLSTSTSQPGAVGSKPCSTSQRTPSRLRNDHHARITSRSTSVP